MDIVQEALATWTGDLTLRLESRVLYMEKQTGRWRVDDTGLGLVIYIGRHFNSALDMLLGFRVPVETWPLTQSSVHK